MIRSEPAPASSTRIRSVGARAPPSRAISETIGRTGFHVAERQGLALAAREGQNLCRGGMSGLSNRRRDESRRGGMPTGRTSRRPRRRPPRLPRAASSRWLLTSRWFSGCSIDDGLRLSILTRASRMWRMPLPIRCPTHLRRWPVGGSSPVWRGGEACAMVRVAYSRSSTCLGAANAEGSTLSRILNSVISCLRVAQAFLISSLVATLIPPKSL